MAFSLPAMGHWQFKVMPFGLCNAPATFERLMEHVLTGLSWKVCLVYLDDIIVYGLSFSSQIMNLRQVFQRLRWAGLKLSPKKCILFQRQFTYLGYIVSEYGVKADPSKLEAIASWPVPTNVRERKSFLGLASYYRRLIADFAKIENPLHRLTEKNSTFIWTSETYGAFKKIKEALCDISVLVLPKRNVEFILDTDASNGAIGAVLSQVSDGVERPVAYYSKKNLIERNDSVV